MNVKRSLLDTERWQLRWTVALLLCSAFSGYITWLFGLGRYALQFAVLLHAVSGVLLSVLLVLYLWSHFRRTLGVRRAGTLFSGLLAATLLLAGIGTGLYLTLYGQTENTRWLLNLHIACISLSLAAGLLHLIGHALSYDIKRRQRQENPWPSSKDLSLRHAALWLFMPALLVFAAGMAYEAARTPYQTTPVVENYTLPYGEHPFRPSQTETYHGGFIEEREIARGEDCAGCHPDIARQWQQSVHRHAADDPTYVTNINLLSDKQGIEATRYCEGCHAPTALLTGQLSAGGQHGGIEGTAANRDGVGCLSCHTIDRIMHTRGVASFRYGSPSTYLFEETRNPIATQLRHWLLRLNPKLHRREMARPPLASPELCASCHAQFMDKDMNRWGWVKMQDEYRAWHDSPFSGHNREEFGRQATVTCQGCHMAPELADDPSASAEGLVAGHYFPAANTLVARHFGHTEQVDRTREFLRGNKLSISIEAPNRKDATQTFQALDESIRTRTEAPYFYYLGETAELNIIVSNRAVGHNFPGGTLDINEAWAALTVTDAAGELVFVSGALSGDEYAELAVDPAAYFYRSRPVDRQGQLVWKHDLFNRVGEAEKRVIPAGKSDLLQYRFVIPDWVKTPLVVTATLKYRKLNDRYARWALGEDYAPVPIVDMARDTLTIPVYIRDPVPALR
ncbi:MAG: multiheme c-type cytochrome [Gammaproteobacteria bacterium]|nr:multiheme c-type cytochrome [Gammaproteobacteria bacterium]